MREIVKKSITLLFLSSLFLLANEPSAFEAGNLDSPNPYGLTTSEKYILQNKKSIKNLKNENILLKEEISALREKLEGLKSVTEGVDRNLNKIKLKIDELQKQNGDKVKRLEDKVSQIDMELNKTISIQSENFSQIKNVLKELTSLIDNINSSYVSKDEFKKEIKSVYSYIDEKINKLQEKRDLSSKSGHYLYTTARKYYSKKSYDKAKEYFLWSIKKRYKPATSSFYIGEICYYQKKYSCAVEYYKKSVSIYSKSSFMPTLMLHTAISLENLGQKKEAKLFYKNLIKKFPKTKAAKIAKSKLAKLNS